MHSSNSGVSNSSDPWAGWRVWGWAVGHIKPKTGLVLHGTTYSTCPRLVLLAACVGFGPHAAAGMWGQFGACAALGVWGPCAGLALCARFDTWGWSVGPIWTNSRSWLRVSAACSVHPGLAPCIMCNIYQTSSVYCAWYMVRVGMCSMWCAGLVTDQLYFCHPWSNPYF